MYINQAAKLIVELYKRQIETGRRFSIELQSGPGIGKSEVVKQTSDAIRKQMGLEKFSFKPFFLSTLEQPDVRGFGLPAKDTDGGAIMKFTRAPWMPLANESEHGIVFLDEFRQASHDVQKPAAELLLNGAVGDSKLPITYMVIAASNRESDRSGVQRELAFISNRRMLINIEPNLDAWVQWAEQAKNNIHWAAIAFAKHLPGLVFTDKVPDKAGPFTTPRSLVQASFLIDSLPDTLMPEALAGLLGEGVAAQFLAFIRVAAGLPTFEEITGAPDTARIPEKDRPDVQYATMQMLAHRVTADTAVAVFKYLKRMPKEFQIAGLQAIVHRTPEVIQHRDFITFLRENKDLLAHVTLLKRTA